MSNFELILNKYIDCDRVRNDLLNQFGNPHPGYGGEAMLALAILQCCEQIENLKKEIEYLKEQKYVSDIRE